MTISACFHAVTMMTQFSSPSVLLCVLRWIPEVNRLDLFAIMRCFETDLYLFGCVQWCIRPWPYGPGAHTDQHSAKCVESAWCSHADGLLPVLGVQVAWSHVLSRAKRLANPPKYLSWCKRADSIRLAPTFYHRTWMEILSHNQPEIKMEIRPLLKNKQSI